MFILDVGYVTTTMNQLTYIHLMTNVSYRIRLGLVSDMS